MQFNNFRGKISYKIRKSIGSSIQENIVKMKIFSCYMLEKFERKFINFKEPCKYLMSQCLCLYPFLQGWEKPAIKAQLSKCKSSLYCIWVFVYFKYLRKLGALHYLLCVLLYPHYVEQQIKFYLSEVHKSKL